jgi:formate hydrogenlyase transcriptional activator
MEELVDSPHGREQSEARLPSGRDGTVRGNRTHEIAGYKHLLSEMSATRNSLAAVEAGKVFRETFACVGKSVGIDRWVVTVFDGDCREVKPLVWYDVDAIDPMIPLWFERDPNVADRVRHWFLSSKAGEVQRWHLPAEVNGTKGKMIDVFRKAGIKSGISVPLSLVGPVTATFSAFTTHAYRPWPDDLIPFFRFFGDAFIGMLRCTCLEETIRNASPVAQGMMEPIRERGRSFSGETSSEQGFSGIVGESDVFRKTLLKVRQVAATDATVLILGETGVGKGVIARAIHGASQRRDRPLVQVNCAALAPSLIESELFGHEKGAFTGAMNRRLGRFEVADGSTLFLDEIGDLPLELQSKLLRVLDEGEFERIGTSRTIRTDLRVIAATNRDLAKDVEAGKFRRDLWYRLNVFPILVPPLRERRDDIEPLVRHFIQTHEQRAEKVFDPVPPQVMSMLSRYPWPGNVRELENLVERAVITAVDSRLSVEVPGFSPLQPSASDRTLDEVEREHILTVLKCTKWRIQGPEGAAQRLGLRPSTLRSRMKNLRISRPGFPEEGRFCRSEGPS